LTPGNVRALGILARHGFEGVVIPDHTPEMTCGAPWHAGMAFALGYLRCALQALEGPRSKGERSP
jgi:mannonate dehydratase